MPRPEVEVAGQLQDARNVVGRVARLQLIGEPQPLLSEGKREDSVTRDRPQRRLGPGGGRQSIGVESAGEGGNRRRLEQRAQLQLDLKRLSNPRATRRAGAQFRPGQKIFWMPTGRP